MTPGRHWLPSKGFLLVVLSWSAAFGLVAWGVREPDLDRLSRQLAKLETTDKTVAGGKLMKHLRSAALRHPALVGGLAGSSGARVLEARRDGWAAGPRAHVLLSAALGAAPVRIECKAIGTLSLGSGKDTLRVPCLPGEGVLQELPEAWRGRALVVDAKWNGPEGAVRVTGTLSEGAAR